MGSFLPKKISSGDGTDPEVSEKEVASFIESILTELLFMAEAGFATDEEKIRIGKKMVLLKRCLVRKHAQMLC
jgi:hypothetical protein